MPQAPGQARTTFAVPLTSTNYAPEIMRLPGGPKINEVAILIETLVATSTVELWLLRVDGDSANDGHYIFAKSFSAAGLQDLVILSPWRAAQIRAKSGGTAGSSAVSAAWT